MKPSRASKQHRRAPLVAAALLFVVLAAAGCGVPLSQSAVTLPLSDKVPAAGEQSSPSSTTPPTSLPPDKASSQKSVFFFGPDDHLVEVHRPESKLVTPNVVLYLLAIGPNAKEKTLTSDVPSSASVDVQTPRKQGVANVYLDNESFGALFAAQLYGALGQIVYTLMSDFPSITGIRFYLRVPGGTIPFNYTPAGETVDGPVTTKTYAALAPLPPETSKTKKS